MVLRRGQWLALLFFVAFGVRVAGVLATGQYRDRERFELERVSISLATRGEFGNPYSIPTGPTAHVSPGYPILLALVFKWFGTGVPGEAVKQLLACAVAALLCALMPAVAHGLQFDRRAGVLAGILTALLPLKFKTETMGDWESGYAALALMLLAVLTASLWRDCSWTLRRAGLAGLAWGISLLFSYAFAFLYLAVFLAGLFVASGNYKRYLVFALVETAVVTLCLAPWAIRNQFALGAPVMGRTNTGLELRLSNNDLAGPSERLNYEHGVYHLYHPLQSVAEARKVRALGEIEYNRIAMQQAREWIRTHPSRFLQLTSERFLQFWFFPDPILAKAAALGILRLLGFAGLVYAWRRQPVSARVLGLILLVLPLPNYLVHVGPKHSFQLDWITTLLATVALVAAYDAIKLRYWSSAWEPSGTCTS